MRSLLFIDDHPIYREGLQRILESAISELEVAVVEGAKEARRWITAHGQVDLCLADHKLDDGDGLGLIAEFKKNWPLMAVGLLCAEPSAVLGAKVEAAGGIACLSKQRDALALAEALETLFAGGTVFDGAPVHGGAGPEFTLRRREILSLATEGLMDKQIAERLGITESTVRNHWQHIFIRLGVGNRTEAVAKAIRQCLI